MGRPVEYGPDVAAAARLLHEAAGGVGAKRLHPYVGELASRLSAFGDLEMDVETQARLGRASAATLERLLAASQVPVRKRVMSLTKPGTRLRSRIAVRTFGDWDDASPEFVEVDTVAHCGATVAGFYLWTWRRGGWRWMWYGAKHRSEWEQRYGRPTGGCLCRCLDWTATMGLSS